MSFLDAITRDPQGEVGKALVALASGLKERLDRIDRDNAALAERLDRIERALIVIAECVEPEEEEPQLTLDGQPAGNGRREGEPL